MGNRATFAELPWIVFSGEFLVPYRLCWRDNNGMFSLVEVAVPRTQTIIIVVVSSSICKLRFLHLQHYYYQCYHFGFYNILLQRIQLFCQNFHRLPSSSHLSNNIPRALGILLARKVPRAIVSSFSLLFGASVIEIQIMMVIPRYTITFIFNSPLLSWSGIRFSRAFK